MKTTMIALGCLAAVSLTTPAAARDGAFTGPRAEVSAGYDILTSPDALEGADDNIEDRISGIRAGAAVGYDWAIGPRLTIGAEVGVGTNVSGGITAQLNRDSLKIDGARDVDVAARLGFRVSPRTLIFGKVGYANSRLSVTYKEWQGAGTYETTHYADGTSALRLGAGTEQQVSGRFYVKAEYRWTQYGDDVVYQGRSTRHQILAGVGARF